MKQNGFAVIAVVMLLMGSLQATNHYIRAGASGNGSDWDNALPKMPDRQVRGDTYYIADGEYPTMSLKTPESGTTRITVKKATIADHGTGTGWKDEYGDGYAKISAPPYVYKDGNEEAAVYVHYGYYTIDGVTGGGPGSWDTGHGFWFHGCENYTVCIVGTPVDATQRGLELRHIKFTCQDSVDVICGIYTKQVTVLAPVYEYLYFKDSWGNPFQVPGKDDVLIQYCMVDRMRKFWGPEFPKGSHMEAVRTFPEGKHNRYVIRHNIWKDCVGSAIMILNGNDHKVYGNVFYWTEYYKSINEGYIGTLQYGAARNCHVYNNTFVDLRATGFFPKGSNGGHVVRNNVFVNIWDDYHKRYTVYWNSSCAHSDNYYYLAGRHDDEPGRQLSLYSHPFRSWTRYGGLNNDLRLAAATEAGSPLAAEFGLDMDGTQRGSDGVWDRGAFEYDPAQSASVRSVEFGMRNHPAHPQFFIPNPLSICDVVDHQRRTGFILYDLTGQQLKNGHGMKPGVYFIELNGNQQPVTIR